MARKNEIMDFRDVPASENGGREENAYNDNLWFHKIETLISYTDIPPQTYHVCLNTVV